MPRQKQPTKDAWRISAGAHGPRWIFPARPADTVNQYADFFQEFSCEGPQPDGALYISADTDFAVWLNGRLIGFGQYSNFPDRKTYECFPVGGLLREGKNSLAVTVFYNGRTSSVYWRGDPGLLFEIRGRKALAVSGIGTRCRYNPCYHSGPIAIVSGQLAYTFGYDARGEDNFNRENYIPGEGWASVAETEATLPEARSVLHPRPVARLVDAGCTASRLLAAGHFHYDTALAESEHQGKAVAQTPAGLVLDYDASVSQDTPSVPVSPAWFMQHAKLSEGCCEELTGGEAGIELEDQAGGLDVSADSLAEQDGIYLLFDMGQQEVGYLELDIEAPAGTMLDIGYGEHLDDGRVRSFVGRRSFGARYICREGRQRFSHPFLRWAGRYLQLHVHGLSFTLYRLSLRRKEYPLEARGVLTTGNPLHAQILDTGRRTLHLCMHEHYEDTPWREQALYANDARTQALCGYYAYGETAMPAASFSLLGQGLREDGFLYLTAPAKPGLTIPSFTLVWMLAVRDHYLYSGDDALVRAFLPQILSMLCAFLADRKDGLLPLRQVKGIWHFYDWSAGMSGYSDEDFAQGLRADAPLNCFLILALEAAQQMLSWCGEKGGEDLAAAADELRQGVVARFWDAGEGVFRTHERAAELTDLTQALAVLAGVGDDAMRDRALERMARPDSGLAGPGLSQSYYTFEALMTQKERYGAGVVAGIESTWGRMLDAGATTFWETINGASDFSGAGSLCHGWSAVPIYILFHDVLGVRPLEPGFRTFTVDPLPGITETLSGCVPVPGGEIVVDWKHPGREGDVKVQAPSLCHWLQASES